MTLAHTITIAPIGQHIEVRVGDQLVAATDHPLVLEETGLPNRYYLPRDDVRLDQLRKTSFQTTCPFKGRASYWSLEIDGVTHDGIVWSYEEPIPGAEAITGYLSFYPDRAQVTVDGEPLS